MLPEEFASCKIQLTRNCVLVQSVSRTLLLLVVVTTKKCRLHKDAISVKTRPTSSAMNKEFQQLPPHAHDQKSARQTKSLPEMKMVAPLAVQTNAQT